MDVQMAKLTSDALHRDFILCASFLKITIYFFVDGHIYTLLNWFYTDRFCRDPQLRFLSVLL